MISKLNNFKLMIPAIYTLMMFLTSQSAFAQSTLSPKFTFTKPQTPLVAQTRDGHSINILQSPGWKVVYFWSSSCPCVKACERYSFLPLAQKYKGKVAFYAVASDSWDLNMPAVELNKQIESHHLPFPVLLDTTHTFAKTLNARVTPETFIIDPQGKVVFDGMPDDSRRYLFQDASLVKGRAHPVPQTYLSKALAEALAGQTITPSPIKHDGCIIAW